jgi:hypothetical protein
MPDRPAQTIICCGLDLSLNSRGSLDMKSQVASISVNKILFATVSLAVILFAGSANASIVVVLSANGVYAFTKRAGVKVEKVQEIATDLCRKNGGVEIRVVATLGGGPPSAGQPPPSAPYRAG